MSKEYRREYARNWYAKNKKRLLACPRRRKEKNERAKRYYAENKDKFKKLATDYVDNNKEKVKDRKRAYYIKNKDRIKQNSRIKRQAPGYKEYVKQYRLKNIEKIRRQARRTGMKYIIKQIRGLTDQYIISQILLSPYNKLSLQELKKMTDLIERKRNSIIQYRAKFSKQQIEEDILVQIEAVRKQREHKPYEFVQTWRD